MSALVQICILYRSNAHREKKLVLACPCRCRIVMVDKLFLINFMIECAMWTVVISRARFIDVR